MSTATAFDPFCPTVPNGATELIAAGGHLGALVGLFDVGTHPEEYQGKTEGSVRKIYLVWELEEEDSRGNRHLIGVEFTNSLGKKAALAQMITRCFPEVELAPGVAWSLRQLLGRSFDLNIKNEKKGQYTNHKLEKSAIGPVHRRDTPIDAKDQRPHLMASVNQGIEAITAMDLSWVPRDYGKSVLDMMMASEEWGGKPAAQPEAATKPDRAADLATVEKILLGVADQQPKTPSRDTAIDEAYRIMKAANIPAADLSDDARLVFDDTPF